MLSPQRRTDPAPFSNSPPPLNFEIGATLSRIFNRRHKKRSSPSLPPSRDSPLPFLSLFIQSNPRGGGGGDGGRRADIDRKGERGLLQHRHRHPKRAAGRPRRDATGHNARREQRRGGEIEILKVERADWRREGRARFPTLELLSLPHSPLSLSLCSPREWTEKLDELFKGEIEGGARSRQREEGRASEGGAKTAEKLFQSRSATIYKTMSYISPSPLRSRREKEKEKEDKRFWESLVASRTQRRRSRL